MSTENEAYTILESNLKKVPATTIHPRIEKLSTGVLVAEFKGLSDFRRCLDEGIVVPKILKITKNSKGEPLKTPKIMARIIYDDREPAKAEFAVKKTPGKFRLGEFNGKKTLKYMLSDIPKGAFNEHQRRLEEDTVQVRVE